MTGDLLLRHVTEADLPFFFEQASDPDAVQMAAFTPKDRSNREAFVAHWNKILSDPTCIARTITAGEVVVGSIGSYLEAGKPEVTYWIDKSQWGRGIATRALEAFLSQVDTRRPMRARAAKDNVRSIRVLEKCAFRVVAEARGFANARGAEIDELVFELTG